MENWTVEEATEWAICNFPNMNLEELQQCFEDQEIDGSTLIMLATSGSVDQMKLCGFKTVNQQLKLRKLIASPNPSAPQASLAAAKSSLAAAKSGKLTLSAIKSLSPEDQKLYLIKRNKVAAAAWKTWPGNNIPTFKNNLPLLKQLDTLVKSLLPDCELPFFDEKAIRSHIMDTLTERRRQIKNGHDYENPLPSKRIKTEHDQKERNGESKHNKKMLFEFDKGEEEEFVSNRDGDDDVSKKEVLSKNKNDVISVDIHDDKEGLDRNENGDDDVSKKEELNKNKNDVISVDVHDEGLDKNENGISQKSAELIVMVAFGAHSYKEVGRTQLNSAVKFFNLPKSLGKSQLAVPLAAAFLDNDIVSIKEGADISTLCRQDVMKCGTF